MSALKRKAGASAGNDSKKSKADGNIASFFAAAPKPAAGTASASASASASAPAAKFDKTKWVESLKPEQKELLQLEIDTLDESWLGHLKDELVSKEFLDLKRFIDREITSGRKVFPPRDDIYSW
jgi:uracil-DNA glycosylase